METTILNQTTIMNTKVTCITGIANEFKQISTPLYHVIVTVPEMQKDTLVNIGNMEYHSAEQTNAKRYVPMFYIGGEFPNHEIKNDKCISYSNLMIIDIDKKDNVDIDLNEIRQTIFNLPYVFGVYKSISQMGLYAIIPIEDGKYTNQYYNYIGKLWKQQFGINIDKQANNIARGRFISYNPDWKNWTKEEVKVWKLKLEEKTQEETKHQIIYPKYNQDLSYMTNRTHLAMQKLVNAGYNADGFNSHYNAWYHVGCEFKNFADGLNLFVRFSQNSCKYHDSYSVIANEYNKCIASGITEDLHRKWQGMALKKFGKDWWKDTQQNIM